MDEHGGGKRRDRVVVCVVGTRPEAVKMAPIVSTLRRSAGLSVRLVTTGQHRGLLDRALADFGLTADVDLDLMRPDQSLAETTGRALIAVSEVLGRMSPSLVLAQGDTTTVVATALACFYRQVPFGHVEAGLRTGQPYRPFPEEKNREVSSHLADLHFAPTDQARDNLLREGIAPASIFVSGNTVIDALRMTASRPVEPTVVPATPRFLLVTAHRRESQGAPLEQICAAVADLVRDHPDLSVVFPVHPNPRVREVVGPALGGLDRVHLVEPQGYAEFVALMKRSYLILTDSGGVQEEAPALGKPVLVLRDETERPEAVAAGTVQLVGTRREAIRSAVEALLNDPARYRRFATVVNPYGDGWAAERIARVVLRRLGLDAGPMPTGVDESWSSAPRTTVAGSTPCVV
jgi:UDP-N-acetylglucosamine 2-epimerase (non-hydrolysing)